MRMRITEPAAKIGFVLAAGIAMLLAGVCIALVGWRAAGQLIVLAVGGVALLIAVRVFRGASEDVTVRRPWWRMTERPLSGYVVGTLLVAQAIVYATMPSVGTPARVLGCLVAGVAAVMFFFSSVRLARQQAGTARRR